jgi:hypothetical protein
MSLEMNDEKKLRDDLIMKEDKIHHLKQNNVLLNFLLKVKIK